MKNHTFLLFISLLLMATVCLAQSGMRFEHISQEHELSSDAVTCVYQDQYGFIWIGTEDGLNRFDGYENVVFRSIPEDTSSLSSHWILRVFEDRQGQIWVGTQDGINLLDRTTGRFRRFFENTRDSLKKDIESGYSIYEDRKGRLWIGGTNLSYLDSASMEVKRHPLTEMALSLGIDFVIFYEDKLGRLWCGMDNGFFYLESGSEQLGDSLLSAKIRRPLLRGAVKGSVLDSKNNLWVLREKELLRVNTTTSEVDTIALEMLTQEKLTHYFEILELAGEQVWLGKETRGLERLDLRTGQVYTYSHDPLNPNSIASGIGERLAVDRQGSLWVMGLKGLDRLSSKYINQFDESSGVTQFSHFQVAPDEQLSELRKWIRAFLKDRNGNFWVGTYEGLFQFQVDKGSLVQTVHYTHNPSTPNSLSDNGIRALLEDRRGDIWVATRKGLNRIKANSREIERIQFTTPSLSGLSDDTYWSLIEDEQGVIWIGTGASGLLRLDPITLETRQYINDPEDEHSLSFNEVLKIFQDGEGRIWAGTFKVGLNLYNPSDDNFTRFLPDPQDPQAISGFQAWSIFEDDQGRLWVGTQNGLNQLMVEDHNGKTVFSFERYQEEDGLVNNIVYGILQDKLGRLWLSTMNGLSCFDPEAKTFLNFDEADGLQSNSFNPNAYYRDPESGELFFGGTNGYYRFQAENFKADTFAPPVLISSLTRFNKKENEGQPIVDYFPAGKESFRFSYLDDIITFKITMPNFEDIDKNQYEYQMEGLNSNWISMGTNRTITFTDLNAGNYTLRVRGINHDGVESEKETSLKLRVVPPWWLAIWAKIIYLLSAIAALLGIYQYQLNKKLVEQEALQLKELDIMKSRFFTNISHEFRTPLTIIKGISDKMSEQPEKWLSKGTEMIHRNSDNLLNLVNQILDLRKLESGKLQLNLVQLDVIGHIKYIFESFHSLAQSKDIQLHFQSESAEVVMDVDPEKMIHIVSNLLSNAIKFTTEGGDIFVQLKVENDNSLVMRVEDNGIGIPEDKLPHIFDRFYQVDDSSTRKGEGTGIGLSLTYELIKLMDGVIEVASQAGKGTVFSVILPIRNTAGRTAPVEKLTEPKQLEQSIAMASLEMIGSYGSNQNSLLPSLLIVEDNPDVRQYLIACLEDQFQIDIAQDGQEGIEKAIEQVPDIIISDVMMPRKNGFELCAVLKEDVRTSHIPIVLLTAKADVDSRIQGLERGADVYLAKPFNKEELFVRLRKLIELRQRLQQRYSDIEVQPASEDIALQKEDEFIIQLRTLIHEHLDEEEYGINEICRDAAMSRAQLHRKIKALTGRSTSHFIRLTRLIKAKELLLDSKFSISEIAYEVGFSSPKYFSQVFSEEFGQAPREFLRNQNNS